MAGSLDLDFSTEGGNMRLTRKDFQHYGRDYQKRSEQFQSFIAAVRQLIESAHIPSLSIVGETPQELRVQYIGHHYERLLKVVGVKPTKYI